MNLSLISTPCKTTLLFDRILTIDWYDGFTSGAVNCAAESSAFRFDLIAWGPGQSRRIFAFSRIETSAFENVVQLWSLLEPPQSPVWHIPWRLMQADLLNWNGKLDSILANAAKQEIAMETDNLFQTAFAARAISAEAPALPEDFGVCPPPDDYEAWHRFIGTRA
ncbi:MAG: hypothetical protein WCF17_20855 [Terracidiphilus sp.]